jgi:hypothetical protein
VLIQRYAAIAMWNIYDYSVYFAHLSFLILALIAFVALVQSPLLLASLNLVLLLSLVVFKSSTGVGGLLLLLLLLLLPITLSLLTALVFKGILLLAPLSMPD